MLYFPRGSIHYGVTCRDTGSHHLTVSTYQKSSWADLIGDALQAALTQLADSHVEFRRGVPVDWTRKFGSGVKHLPVSHVHCPSPHTLPSSAVAAARAKGKSEKDNKGFSVGGAVAVSSLAPLLSKQAVCGAFSAGSPRTREEIRAHVANLLQVVVVVVVVVVVAVVMILMMTHLFVLLHALRVLPRQPLTVSSTACGSGCRP
jgi:hypothetical protein